MVSVVLVALHSFLLHAKQLVPQFLPAHRIVSERGIMLCRCYFGCVRNLETDLATH